VVLVVGALLAFAVGLLATGTGLDRERAFYPVVTIVIASYYAICRHGRFHPCVVLESLVGMVFLAAAVSGFKSSLWVVVAALAAHGIFDLGHGTVISNPGVPSWGRGSASRMTLPQRPT
jgi:hypothetical protein